MPDVRKYLGRRWACPCDPPDTFDCWELVVQVRADMGLDTPPYVPVAERIPSGALRYLTAPPSGWRRADPAPGVVAVCGRLCTHVGVYLSPGQIMHTAPDFRGGGVVRCDRADVATRLFGIVRGFDYAAP